MVSCLSGKTNFKINHATTQMKVNAIVKFAP